MVEEKVVTFAYGLRCNDMSLFIFVETSHAFDDHIIRLCRTGSENNILRIGTN